MSERELSPRTSVISFVLTSAIATAVATGLFVLLDPRTQGFWADRFNAFVTLVRSLFVR